MGLDVKYGRVTTERGTIGEDEPVVVFRAQDETLCLLLAEYRDICERHGCEPEHLEAIDRANWEVFRWQEGHAPKTPDTDPSAGQYGGPDA